MSNKTEILQKQVINLKNLADQTTNKNIWLANKTIRLVLSEVSLPNKEKRKKLRKKRK